MTDITPLLLRFSSVTQSYPSLWDPMNHSMPGPPVHHQLLESMQTHVHQVSDASQASYLLSSPSAPALNLSTQASGSFQMSQFFTLGGQSIRVSSSTSVLTMNTQDWRHLGLTGWISLQSKGLSRVYSNTILQKHQFFSAHLSLESNSHIHTWPLEKIAFTRWTFVGKVMSLLLRFF